MFMPKGASQSYWWLSLGKVLAGVLTIAILYFLIKELIKIVKESNEGKCSDKCDLD